MRSTQLPVRKPYPARDWFRMAHIHMCDVRPSTAKAYTQDSTTESAHVAQPTTALPFNKFQCSNEMCVMAVAAWVGSSLRSSLAQSIDRALQLFRRLFLHWIFHNHNESGIRWTPCSFIQDLCPVTFCACSHTAVLSVPGFISVELYKL